jgi:hypothetical protein
MATESPPTEPSPAATKYCPECGSRIDAEAAICPECGVAQESAERQTAPEPASRILAAAVGGVVTFILGWIPLIGPIPGGVVAGYLRGSDVTESTLTGLLANVLASIPGVLLAVLFLFLGGLGAVMEGDGGAAVGLVVWLIIFALAFAYYYALGALGGFIGAKVTDRGEPGEA